MSLSLGRLFGKDDLAKVIHYSSPRARQELISINSRAIPHGIQEDELFGHDRGAFTGADSRKDGFFEMAQDSFLFLNEINETGLDFQRILLDVLQHWEFRPIGRGAKVTLNIRVIIGSSEDLKEMVQAKTFLAPLYYRISGIKIYIPPLTERMEEIKPLAEAFLRKECPHRAIKLSEEALSLLKTYSWPGNVRELENEIIRIVFDNDDIMLIQPEHLSEEIQEGVRLDVAKEVSENLEREQMVRALKATNGNISKAAKILKIPRSTLDSAVRRLGLPNFRKK